MSRIITGAFTCLLLVLSLSCQTKPDPYTMDLSRREFFQKAIDAAESRDYKLAVDYYEAFKAKHPDDQAGHLWAEYEIAFLYHKMGNDKLAVELLDSLLQRYESHEGEESTVEWPDTPRILAEKVREEIMGNDQENE